MEFEYTIDSASILIGRGEHLIPEGVFDRYFHQRDPATGHRLVVFRKYHEGHDGENEIVREAVFDPDRILVHSEYKTYLELYSADTYQPCSFKQFDPPFPLAYCYSPEGRYHYFDPMKFGPPTKVTPYDLDSAPDDDDVVMNIHQLREKGITGFNIKFKNGTKRFINTDQVQCVVVRPGLKRLIFYWEGAKGKMQGFRYHLPRIKEFTTVNNSEFYRTSSDG